MSQSPSSNNPVQPNPPTTPNRPIFRLSNWQIILILLVIIGGRLVIDFSQRIVEGQQKLAEQRALEAQIAALRSQQKSLQISRVHFSNQAYVEAWAHDQGKMILDGETLVIPVYQLDPPFDEAPLLNTSEATSQQAQPAWLIWWSLFFDTEPPTNPNISTNN